MARLRTTGLPIAQMRSTSSGEGTACPVTAVAFIPESDVVTVVTMETPGPPLRRDARSVTDSRSVPKTVPGTVPSLVPSLVPGTVRPAAPGPGPVGCGTAASRIWDCG